ncbi:PREDICTED: YEATS domain-containing protein 2 isoform X3 [Acromyrmex echinatior]|uniref:YEATS domain-containing protein 2 isoform X3 n=1 Tax=Acromyrmex echinatior TaxID=103372 RepID=UPI000580CD44|nr:PREDICTED: YEATS domain-containing protein 2 isoform X3 [Acromyrmex echinatior]
MSAPEDLLNGQDPDYVSATSNDSAQQKIYEENARNTTAKKITAIIEKEFSLEIDLKEKEILQIQDRLHKALKIFHLLRYIIITNFYNRKQCQISQAVETKQTRIHPAIKTLLGKSPKFVDYTDLAVPSTSTDPRFLYDDKSFTSDASTALNNILKIEEDANKSNNELQSKKRKMLAEEFQPRKIPRYVPPKSSLPEKSPSRGNSHKVRKRIVVGNISKWIPPDWREDASSHKWTMYVRGDKDEKANISTFVSKKTANSSETCNLHLKPLQISIPPNIIASSSKHILLLKDEKSVPVDFKNIPSKSRENLRMFVDSVKVSVPSVAKLNVPVSQGVSILKKLPNIKANAQQKDTVNNNKKKTALLKLKDSNSLLLNVNENVPILKIVDSHDSQYNYSIAEAIGGIPSVGKQEFVSCAKSEDKTIVQRTKITLGKDKFKIQSKKDLYEAVLQSIDTANIADVEALIRFIIRRLPIVTQDVRDPDYRRLHPYACYSKEEYLSYNVGKQRAIEWYRAKIIRSFLQMKLILSDQLWSIKEIMLWARLHGYTPSQSVFSVQETAGTSDTKKLPDTMTATMIVSTYTEPITLQKWLQTCQQEPNRQSDNYINDEEIDVESIKECPRRITIDRRKNGNKNSNYSTDSTLIPIELDENLLPFHNFVCDTAQEIGIKIEPEEIIPGVLYCAASRVIMQVVECFVEDLTRSSLARAWERNNGNECPKLITLNDVRNALANREEFDIFTNEGLGSRQELNSETTNL